MALDACDLNHVLIPILAAIQDVISLVKTTQHLGPGIQLLTYQMLYFPF